MRHTSKRVQMLQNATGGSVSTIEKLVYILDTYTDEQYDAFTRRLDENKTTYREEYERAKKIRVLIAERDGGL